MSVGATITVEFNRFGAIANAFGQTVADETNRAIFGLVAYADPLTPVETGALKANKVYQMATPADPSGAVGWEEDYSVYQEFGTIHQAPVRFAGRAADRVFPEYVSALQALEARL